MKTNYIYRFILGTSLALSTFACTDLGVESPSVVNPDFVFSEPTTARAALLSIFIQMDCFICITWWDLMQNVILFLIQQQHNF